MLKTNVPLRHAVMNVLREIFPPNGWNDRALQWLAGEELPDRRPAGSQSLRQGRRGLRCCAILFFYDALFCIIALFRLCFGEFFFFALRGIGQFFEQFFGFLKVFLMNQELHAA